MPVYNLRNENEFRLPNPRIEQFKKFPLYALPYEWNHAGVLTLYPNRATFKFALKDQLLAEIMTLVRCFAVEQCSFHSFIHKETSSTPLKPCAR